MPWQVNLSQKEGIGRIPLSYIIHDLDVPDPIAVYETEREWIKAMVLLQGPCYVCDNETIYGILKTLVLEGPGWPWISHLDKHKDGQATWKAIMAHYDGDSFQNHQKESAYSSIANSQYQGE